MTVFFSDVGQIEASVLNCDLFHNKLRVPCSTVDLFQMLTVNRMLVHLRFPAFVFVFCLLFDDSLCAYKCSVLLKHVNCKCRKNNKSTLIPQLLQMNM